MSRNEATGDFVVRTLAVGANNPSLQGQVAERHWAVLPLDIGDDGMQSAVVVQDFAGYEGVLRGPYGTEGARVSAEKGHWARRCCPQP